MTRPEVERETSRNLTPSRVPGAGRRIKSSRYHCLGDMIWVEYTKDETSSASVPAISARLDRNFRDYEIRLSIQEQFPTNVCILLHIDDANIGAFLEERRTTTRAGDSRIRDAIAGQQFFPFFDDIREAHPQPIPLDETGSRPIPPVIRAIRHATALSDRYANAGLFAWTAGSVTAVAFMALAIGPAWIGFLAAFLPASALAAWAVADA